MKLKSEDLTLINPYSPVLFAYNQEGVFVLYEPPNMSGLKVSKVITPFSKLFAVFGLVSIVLVFVSLFLTAGLVTAIEVSVAVGLVLLVALALARFRLRALEEKLSDPLRSYVEGDLRAKWPEVEEVLVEDYDKTYDVGKIVLVKRDGTKVEIPLVNSPYEKAEELKRFITPSPS